MAADDSLATFTRLVHQAAFDRIAGVKKHRDYERPRFLDRYELSIGLIPTARQGAEPWVELMIFEAETAECLWEGYLYAYTETQTPGGYPGENTIAEAHAAILKYHEHGIVPE